MRHCIKKGKERRKEKDIRGGSERGEKMKGREGRKGKHRGEANQKKKNLLFYLYFY